MQGASLHALWRLEADLLKRFGVPSFQALQLPAGCSSLLSAVAAQDELAAALTGYADAWDCGVVQYEDVLRVVQQALSNMQHSIMGKSRTTAEGRCQDFGCCSKEHIAYWGSQQGGALIARGGSICRQQEILQQLLTCARSYGILEGNSNPPSCSHGTQLCIVLLLCRNHQQGRVCSPVHAL